MSHRVRDARDTPGWRRSLSTVTGRRIIPIAILSAAALARFWQLDFHSIWFDEAVSLQWASADLAFIWEKTFPLIEEKHPPAYYGLLHLWLRMLEPLGLAQSDAAIRSLGAGLGVITAGATMALATRLSGRTTGYLTGLLVALSPLLVWYSQELRMFQPATTGIMVAALALVCAWQTGKPMLRAIWWLCGAAGLLFALYSYLFSAFIMPAAGLSLLLLYRAQPNLRRLMEGILVLALVTALFLPLAQNAWGVNAAESTPGQAFANFWNNHQRLLHNFTLWRVRWAVWLTSALLVLWGSLVILGVSTRLGLRLRRHPARPDGPQNLAHYLDAYWLWLWLIVPLLIANLLLSRSGSIFNEDRYLLFLAPFALWALARGLETLRRRLPTVGVSLMAITVLAFGAALPQVWSPANYRENWRAAAQYIIDYGRAHPYLTAAGVAHIDYTNLPLQWYLRQVYTHDQLPVFFPYGGWVDPAEPETSVAPYIRGIEDLGVDTLWLTQAHTQHVDPTGAVEAWIQSTYPIVTELYPAGIKLTGHILRREYDTLPHHLNSDGRSPEPVELLSGLALHECRVSFSPIAARDTLYHPPSGWVHLQTWWSATDPTALPTELRLIALVLGPDSVWGESLSRPADTFQLHPPHLWTRDAFIRAETDVNLNPLTPPGEYQVEIRIEGTSVVTTAPCGRVEIR